MRLMNSNPASVLNYLNRKLTEAHHFSNKCSFSKVEYLKVIQNILEEAIEKKFLSTWLPPDSWKTRPLVYKAMTIHNTPIEIKVPL